MKVSVNRCECSPLQLKDQDVVLTDGGNIFYVRCNRYDGFFKHGNTSIKWGNDGKSALDTSFDVKEVLGNGSAFFDRVTITISF